MHQVLVLQMEPMAGADPALLSMPVFLFNQKVLHQAVIGSLCKVHRAMRETVIVMAVIQRRLFILPENRKGRLYAVTQTCMHRLYSSSRHTCNVWMSFVSVSPVPFWGIIQTGKEQ